MRTFKTEAIIIKRKNYSEADRILTVFTKLYGKIQVKAPGIRRIPSRRSSHVELLNYSLLSLYRGRNMPILTEAEMIENFSGVKDNLQAIGLSYHLCELIDGLCPENQENRAVFDLLKDTLNKLTFYCDSGAGVTGDGEDTYPAVKTIQDFEIELLTTLGYYNKSNMLSQNFNTHNFIESILERKLKSYYIFAKLQ